MKHLGDMRGKAADAGIRTTETLHDGAARFAYGGRSRRRHGEISRFGGQVIIEKKLRIMPQLDAQKFYTVAVPAFGCFDIFLFLASAGHDINEKAAQHCDAKKEIKQTIAQSYVALAELYARMHDAWLADAEVPQEDKDLMSKTAMLHFPAPSESMLNCLASHLGVSTKDLGVKELKQDA